MTWRRHVTGALLGFMVLASGACEGERGPVGPAGPQGSPGEDGADGGGVVRAILIEDYVDTPVPSNAVTVPLALDLQAGQFIRYTAWASVQIGDDQGIVELPVLVDAGGGQLAQASVLLEFGESPGDLRFHLHQLQGFYILIAIDVLEAGDTRAALLAQETSG